MESVRMNLPRRHQRCQRAPPQRHIEIDASHLKLRRRVTMRPIEISGCRSKLSKGADAMRCVRAILGLTLALSAAAPAVAQVTPSSGIGVSWPTHEAVTY